MRFQCSHCKGIVAIDDSECGNPVGCGSCGSVTSVPETRFSPGAVINDFVIKKVIGHGGMGQVFLAHQMSLDRPVALKILMEQFSTDSEFIVDFVKEARAAARLNHPNIVQSYAVGEEDGIYFFAMEYVEGETLTDLLHREGALEVERGINIVQQIGEALDFAWKHQQLVHRDVKPDNIMMTSRGIAKLADLGLARVASELLEDMEDDEVMGTPQYICPEQLLGQPMDIRGDIYSLGATFYQTISGHFPFEGKSAAEIARKHLQEPLRPPHEVNENVPESVSYIIQKMMAKKAEDRYNDGTQLATDLNLVLRGEAPIGFTGKKGLKAVSSKSKSAVAAQAAAEAIPEASAIAEDDDDDEAPPQKAGGMRLKAGGKKTKSKLKMGGKKKSKTLTLNKSEDGDDDDDDDVEDSNDANADDTATPTKATRQLSPIKKSGKKSKVVLFAILGAASLLLLAVIAVIVIYVNLSNKYSPKNMEEAQALYFGVESANAKEQEAFKQLEPYIGHLDEYKDDLAALNQVVSLGYKFENDYPNSIFNLNGKAIDYKEMFGTSMFADEIKPYAEKMANLVPQTRAAYEEQLIRLMRRQSHEEEQVKLTAVAEKLEAAADFDKAKTSIANHVRQRVQELRQQLNGLNSEVKRKEKLFAEEQQQARQFVLEKTVKREYRSALSEIRRLSISKTAYGPSIESKAQVIIKQDELLPARSMMRQIQRDFRDLDESKLADELRGSIASSDIKKIKEEMQAAVSQEELLLLTREGWFNDLKQSVEKAEEYWHLVAGTEAKLKDRKVDTKQAKKSALEQFRVNIISTENILLNKVELSSQGTYETKGTVSIPLGDLEMSEFRELAELSFGQGNPDEYTTMLGCYYYYLGGFNAAKTELQKAGGQISDFLSSEAEKSLDIIKRIRMEQYLDELKRMAESGQAERAKGIYLSKLKPVLADIPELQSKQAELEKLLNIESDQ